MGARAEEMAKKFEASCGELNRVVEALSDAMDMIHANNAKHAQEQANVTKAETLALLRTSGDKAATIVRGLSDAELDRTGTVLVGAPTMSAAQAIEGILINHVHEHLASIKATTGAK